MSTAGLSNVSEGSFVRSYDPRNCLAELHWVFFLFVSSARGVSLVYGFSACHVIELSVHARVKARVSADGDKEVRASYR